MSHEQVIVIQPDIISPVRAAPSLFRQRGVALFRLVKPGIVAAELAATIAGLLLTSVTPPLTVVACLLIAVGLAASGAAMANILLEIDQDRLMPRLALRCQVLELVGKRAAWVAAVMAMGASLVLALIFLNPLTALLLLAAQFSYLILYTVCLKPVTPLAMLAGGIPGALPPLIGATAAGSISAASMVLAIGIYCWQIPHFCFLALHHREAYRLAAVPVVPVIHGERRTGVLIQASAGLFVLLPFAFWLVGISAPACAMLLLSGVLLLVCSVWAVQQQNRYWRGFIATLAYLVLLLVTLILDAAGFLSGGFGN